jgi:class 3 adenylate cyclase/tetratricopeptide (TPR) repeat protein
MADDRPRVGRVRHEGARLGSAWGSHVPDYVIHLLRSHPDETPIANAERTDAVVLFADVVGFTAMSEALARSGRYGTEELTWILNGWFDAMSGRISRYGGSVAEFAGDALTAVFRYDARTRRSRTRRAVQCALDMQAAMSRFQSVSTRAGRFRVAMKVGLAAGPLLQTVMGDPAVRLGYVLVGPALERAGAAQHHARGDEVVVDDELLGHGFGAEVVEREGRWWLVRSLRRRASPARPATPATVDEGTASRLAPFLHPAIAERLRSGRRELVNEHRKVTAAFVGLPEVAVDDRRAVAALQRYLAAAVRVIEHYGGHLRQVATGDGGGVLVAFFGAPVSHEDDEERAVRCCLELLKLPGGPFRAGLTTGAVYCGEVGSDARREYAVIGDSVNLAARLMQAAGQGQLLIDRATHDRVRDTTVHDGLRPITVKGKTGPINVWAVRAVRERVGGRSRAPSAAQPLVGRDEEVARGRALLDRVRGGGGQVVSLIGDAGIGKSRLAAEVIRMAGQLGFAVFGGACRSHGTTTSYLVWRSIWRDLLELDTSLPIGDQQAQLVDRIARHVAGSRQRAPLLAPVVNIPVPDSELVAPLDPQTRDELLRSLLLECLRDLAASRPLLLVLEDCHWIDPASGALLEFLARSIGGQQVMLLVIARGTVDDSSPLASLPLLPGFAQLRLAELSGTDARRLVRLRLRERYGADATVAPGVVDRIAERGEGNPFYLGELVSYLHARGVDPRHPRGLATLDLPDGLQRLLMARLDQLSEGEKATIKVASVIGRRFRAGWISEAYPAAGGPQEVARHLERLHQLDLTPRHAAVPELEYQFKHAMTQEAAYQSLTFRMRETLHERVGLLIEATNADRLAQYVDVLAHHYGRTQRVDKQRVWFRAAGDAAKAAFANETAVAYYLRLIPLLPESRRGDVLVELGNVWYLTGRWTEAEQAYRRAMRVARRAGRPEVLAASQRDLGDLFMYNRSYAEAVAWLTRAADEFERLGDRQGLSKTLDRMTFALYQQGAYWEALTAAERHRVLATEAGDLAGVSIALNHTGLVCLDTGRTDEALALLQQAHDTATRAGDRRCLLHAATNLALVHLRNGDHLQAVTQGHQALAVAQEIGHRQTAGVVVGNMGEVYRDEGDYLRATRCFAYALRIAIELRDWTSVADQVANVAATAAAQGHDREAERLFAQAITLARLLDAPYFLCGWLHRLARLHVGQGRLEEAARLNQEALQVAVDHDERDIQLLASVLWQTLQVALGRVGAAAAIDRLRALEGTCTEPHQRAVLLDALWRLDPTQEAARDAAADLYRSLYERTPTTEHQAAYERLTGATLPPGPPLPPLPAALGEEAADVGPLLEQVEQVVPQLRAALTGPDRSGPSARSDSAVQQWRGAPEPA